MQGQHLQATATSLQVLQCPPDTVPEGHSIDEMGVSHYIQAHSSGAWQHAHGQVPVSTFSRTATEAAEAPPLRSSHPCNSEMLPPANMSARDKVVAVDPTFETLQIKCRPRRRHRPAPAADSAAQELAHPPVVSCLHLRYASSSSTADTGSDSEGIC